MQKANDYSEIAESKVLILFFVKELNMPIGNIQFNKIMLENRFMNYFYLQQYLGELIDEGLLEVNKQDGGKFYGISKKGLSILNMFEVILPAGLKKRIKESIKPLRKNVRMETHITANYYPDEENGYHAHLKINEDTFPLMEVKITTGSKEDARNICRNWTTFPQELYSEILEALLKTRKKE